MFKKKKNQLNSSVKLIFQAALQWKGIASHCCLLVGRREVLLM